MFLYKGSPLRGTALPVKSDLFFLQSQFTSLTQCSWNRNLINKCNSVYFWQYNTLGMFSVVVFEFMGLEKKKKKSCSVCRLLAKESSAANGVEKCNCGPWKCCTVQWSSRHQTSASVTPTDHTVEIVLKFLNIRIWRAEQLRFVCVSKLRFCFRVFTFEHHPHNSIIPHKLPCLQ